MQPVLWSLRTTPSQAIGETPFFLVHGVEAVLPVEVAYESPCVTLFDKDSQNQRQIDDVDMLEETRRLALTGNTRYLQALHRYHQKKVHPRELHAEDLVLRRAQTREGKDKLTTM